MLNKIQKVNEYFNLPIIENKFDIYDIIILLETIRKKYEKFEFWNGVNKNKEEIFIIYCNDKEFIGYGKSLKEQIYDCIYKIVKFEQEAI